MFLSLKLGLALFSLSLLSIELLLFELFQMLVLLCDFHHFLGFQFSLSFRLCCFLLASEFKLLQFLLRKLILSLKLLTSHQ